MLTTREIARRINAWTKKPGAEVPVCGHNVSHGRLTAIVLNDKELGSGVVMSCAKCDYKELPELPDSAYRKVSRP